MVTYGEIDNDDKIFYNMNSRFRMPEYENTKISEQNYFYSFNSGNAHFVTLSLDFYNIVFDSNDTSQRENEFPNKKYLEDLLAADLENAEKVQIVFFQRLFYAAQDSHSANSARKVRDLNSRETP